MGLIVQKFGGSTLSDTNKIVILAGFQGLSCDRDIITLGRGGSDTTALAIAAHFSAERCEILKDFFCDIHRRSTDNKRSTDNSQ